MTTASKPATAPVRRRTGWRRRTNSTRRFVRFLAKSRRRSSRECRRSLTLSPRIGSPIAFVAYGLATSFHETGKKMQPVTEIGRGRGKPYGKPGKHGGQPPYGRGDIQLTWDGNYETADDELGLDGALLANFDLALDTEISARIMVRGMTEGWFAGDKAGRHKFARYLPAKGAPTVPKFTSARRIINGIDRAELVAGYAMSFQSGLVVSGWA